MEAEGDRGVEWLSYNMNNTSSDFQGGPILDEIKGHVHSLCRKLEETLVVPPTHLSLVSESPH